MTREEVFTSAFDEYSDALFRHCFFRISNKERAQELVQDAFMKAWDYVSGGGEVKQYRPFLYKVLNNLIVDEYRKKKSSSLDALLEQDGVSEGSFDDLHSGSLAEVEAQVDARRDAEEFTEALKELPEKYRTVVTLRYIDGLQPKEIADLLEETQNVVSVRIHRGVEQLKKKMLYE
ncbi:hypothetical protein COU17_00070 [Candidatus Kaiserbacteria bacterium CG10_big_fil_rev_8_21_14_0_10_49_17]|uniref:RNA polymerase sigma factor n=1 Tax=Candidatus Kaiserbacteria bacterium CG10_big_fil_rev_8_21_14_0_10_49_17 TaxID=1974609 RepID=A0A2M6WFE0_9BACT|nr:MAG: hypothetical protein COU17_00070 [Candidatus Kaiserbacteria bacterium CG10_big_fil_rev_8_21_14_0_10_49_17]